MFGVRSSKNLELWTSIPPPSRPFRLHHFANLHDVPDMQAIEALLCLNIQSRCDKKKREKNLARAHASQRSSW